MEVFEDREDAGRRLAEALARRRDIGGAERVVVLGVPRGGLPVGAEVARRLGAALDVVVVRTLRSPQNPELGFGAVGAGGYVSIDEAVIRRLGVTEEQVAAEVAAQRAAVERRLALYRQAAAPAALDGALAVVVDDGIASGRTARRACRYVRDAGAARLVLAVPVAPAAARASLAADADEVIVLSTPAEFMTVGQAYARFPRLDDDDAVAALRRAAAAA